MRPINIDYFSILAGHDVAASLIRRSPPANTEGALPATLDPLTFWRLCAGNIQSQGDESQGAVSKPVPRGSLQLLFMAAKDGDCLIEALERFAATAQFIRKECRIVLGRSAEALQLTILPMEESSIRAEIYCETFAVVTHCALRWMTGRRLDPIGLRGAASLEDMHGTLLDSMNAPLVRRGHGLTIRYDWQDMNAPILPVKYKNWGEPETNSFRAMLQEGAEHDAEKRSPETDTSVRKILRSGVRSQEAVADALNCGVATLRRRLANEGTSFRRLSAEARSHELQRLLATDMPIRDIAERLGFSDDRSLRRFCRENLSASPSQFRRRRPGPDASE